VEMLKNKNYLRCI